jgi:hypothetical protein
VITSQQTFAAPGAQADSENRWAEAPSLMVRVLSGSPSWVVVYRGSPTGVPGTYTTMITHDSSTNASGETIFAGSQRFPCLHRRLECVSVSGGTIEATGWAT